MAYGKTIICEHAAVASEQPLASMAGYDVLRSGGNAFDAAVVTSFALAVTFHPAGGLGGDFFGMFYETKTGKVHCLNSSGWAPSGLDAELINSKASGEIPLFGPFSCVVPGMVAGLFEMHKKFGTVEFRKLVASPAKLASDGFPASEGICNSIGQSMSDLSREALEVFAPTGRTPRPGDQIRQTRLGKVMKEISEHGSKGFYSGWPAERIVETLQSLGVPAQMGDFRDFRADWVDPLTLDYHGTTVYEVPPNSMGATSLLILKLLADRLSGTRPLSRERIEVTMEAVLPAYAQRDSMLGDPRFGRVDLEAFFDNVPLLNQTGSRVRPGDTTAFSVADSEGNIVSGIQSLFFHFGSRVFVPECGIMLNNRGAGFTLSGPNKVEPRKRPLHTLSSMLLAQGGEPFLAIGTSGGDYRPLQHALFVTNAVDYSLPVESNVNHPRFLWDGGKNLLVEEGYGLPTSNRFEIQKLPMPGRTGVCHAVEVSKGRLTAVCDSRGDGIPAGF